MKINRRIVLVLLTGFVSVLVLGVTISGGCRAMSETAEDPSAGINGGFEIVRNSLPVNWTMYTPKTVPDSDFRIVMDPTVFKEGRQSLKYEVKRCSPTGGWRSPGFTNEFFEGGRGRFCEGRYRVSFWVRNDGSKFRVRAGGVSSKTGNMKTLVESDEQIDGWKRLTYEVVVPEDNWLRLQLNVVRPGTFWIDDLRIERIDER